MRRERGEVAVGDVLRGMTYVLGGYWEALRAIRRQYSPAQTQALQDSRLRSLVTYSFQHVKYYQELSQRLGLKSDAIRSAGDLSRLPFLTKQELRDRLWDFLPHSLPACRVTRTSGSTGIPVCIFADWHSRRCNSAAAIRHFQAVGVPFVGTPILTVLKTQAERDRAPHWVVAQGIHRKYYLNPYVTAQENRDYAVRLHVRLRRPVLTGIATALGAFATAVRDGVFPAFTPRVVLAGGELLLPTVRDLLASTFQTQVLDTYACNEARNIAWQCRAGHGYHINAENLIVEIVRGETPAPLGEVGEVVLTDLNRKVMPIIRYKNGDLARFTDQPCPCGCRLPMLLEIVGRTGQNVRLPDGRVVLWNELKSQMTHPLIRQFQLEQDPYGAFTIRYVPERGGDTGALDDLLRRRFDPILGRTIPVQIERVSIIPPAPGGKSQLVVSHYRPESPAEAGSDHCQ